MKKSPVSDDFSINNIYSINEPEQFLSMHLIVKLLQSNISDWLMGAIDLSCCIHEVQCRTIFWIPQMPILLYSLLVSGYLFILVFMDQLIVA